MPFSDPCSRLVTWFSIAAALLLVACGEGEPRTLVLELPNEEEIEQARQKPSPGYTFAERPLGAPEIEVLLPAVGVPIESPFEVRVRFTPKGESEIDLSSLQLCVKVGWVCIYGDELTEAVRPYASIDGIRHPSVVIDREGRFTLRLTVGDTLGRAASKDFEILLESK